MIGQVFEHVKLNYRRLSIMVTLHRDPRQGDPPLLMVPITLTIIPFSSSTQASSDGLAEGAITLFMVKQVALRRLSSLLKVLMLVPPNHRFPRGLLPSRECTRSRASKQKHCDFRIFSFFLYLISSRYIDGNKTLR